MTLRTRVPVTVSAVAISLVAAWAMSPTAAEAGRRGGIGGIIPPCGTASGGSVVLGGCAGPLGSTLGSAGALTRG